MWSRSLLLGEQSKAAAGQISGAVFPAPGGIML
jgi:hypothetical protein